MRDYATLRTDLERRIGLAAHAVAEGETSMGDALREHFPEAVAGDAPPGWDFPLREAAEGMIRAWAGWNCPDPEQQDVGAAFKRHGFACEYTGGGCDLFYRVRDGRVIVVADDGNAPTRFEQEVSVLAGPGDDARDVDNGEHEPSTMTARAFLDSLAVLEGEPPPAPAPDPGEPGDDGDEIHAAFARVGFKTQSTGGGFYALFAAYDEHPSLDVDGASVCISDGEQPPTRWDEVCVVCYYANGEQYAHHYATPRQYLDMLEIDARTRAQSGGGK